MTPWTEDPYLFRWATGMVRVAILAAAMSTLRQAQDTALRQAQPSPRAQAEGDTALAGVSAPSSGPSVESGPRVGRPVGPGLPPEVEQWSRKAVRGYQEAQEKKWRRWAEAMFGPETEGRR